MLAVCITVNHGYVESLQFFKLNLPICMLYQPSAYGLVRFRHKNHTARVRKRVLFGLLGSIVMNAARKHPEVSQKASNGLSVIHCFHLLKCNFVLFLVIYHCKLTNLYVFGQFVEQNKQFEVKLGLYILTYFHQLRD